MADESANTNEVFRRSTMNRIVSADELDHYIKVTNPSAWVVALAAFLLVAGVIVWAVVAIVPVTVNTAGIVSTTSKKGSESVVICAVNKSTADKIAAMGAKASVADIEANSVTVSRTPVSKVEIVSFLGSEYYASSAELSDWNYLVSIVLDTEPEHSDYVIETSVGEAYLVPVSIVVSETHPINIVLGKQ